MDAKRSLIHPSEPASRAGSKRQSPLFRLHWLLIAAGLCWLSWPVPAEAQPACLHSVCELGGNLSEVCDPCLNDPTCTIPMDCVDDICSDPRDQNANRFCCTDEWDQNCIDQVLEVCGDPTCKQVCSHSPCVIGGGA